LQPRFAPVDVREASTLIRLATTRVNSALRWHTDCVEKIRERTTHGGPTMTRLDVAPHHPQIHVPAPHRQPAVERALRDIALVLHLTQRVKAEILAERVERESRRLPPAAALAM
jgi:hypothetical protein